MVRSGDHPRSRGVYLQSTCEVTVRKGSSPLARGLLAPRRETTGRVGIIPARAGFTSATGTSAPRRWDHPRSRGVYRVGPMSYAEPVGSSPLARGLPHVRTLVRRPNGIIPARAGFTSKVTATTQMNGDHPRSRGVYKETAARPGRLTGSSPLARGLPGRHERRKSRVRIIPARAGFTPEATPG